MGLGAINSLYATFTMLSITSSLILLFLFLRIPALRTEPGTLILGQSLSQFVLDLHWLTIFEEKDTVLCQALGALGLLTFIAAYNYAVAVGAMMACEAELVFVKPIRSCVYHLICWVAALVIAVGAGAANDTGTSIMGTCFIERYTNAEVIMLIVLLIHTPVSLLLCLYAVVCKRRTGAGNPSLVTLVFSLTWFGSCVAHFISWNKVNGGAPESLIEVRSKQFAKITGSLSGLLTFLTRVMRKNLREAYLQSDNDQRQLLTIKAEKQAKELQTECHN